MTPENFTGTPAQPTPTPAPAPIFARRGPGRPRADGSAPKSATQAPPDAPSRPAAAKSVPASGKLDPQKVADQLMGLHAMLALMLKTPALQLTKPEAVQLAGAIIGVAELYKMSVNPKLAAFVQLIAVCGFIYIPRVPAISESLRAQRARPVNPVRAAPQQPTPIRPVPDHVAPQQSN